MYLHFSSLALMLLTLELLTFWQLLAPFKLLLSHFLTVSVLLASVSGWIIFIHSVKQPCSLTVSQPGSAHSFTAGAAVWGLEGLALAWRDFHSSSRPAKSLSACKMQCEFCLLMKRGNGSDGPWNLGTRRTPVTLPQTKREPAFKTKGHISGEYGFALQIWQACPAMTFKFSVKTKESFWKKKMLLMSEVLESLVWTRKPHVIISLHILVIHNIMFHCDISIYIYLSIYVLCILTNCFILFSEFHAEFGPRLAFVISRRFTELNDPLKLSTSCQKKYLVVYIGLCYWTSCSNCGKMWGY